MGWDGIFSNEKEIEIIKKELLSNCEIVYHHRKGNVFYLAVNIKKHPDEVFGIVVLYKSPIRSMEKMFKVMDETMGPCYYGANKKLLELLTPSDNKSANEWRNKCREILNAPKVKKGTVLEFENYPNLHFTYRGGIAFEDISGFIYKIRGWKNSNYRIIEK